MWATISALVGSLILRQQRGGLHDLARLAVAALRDLLGDPGDLQRMVAAAQPSMVVIFLPTASFAEVWQERTATPSRCTVQAPHRPAPQPNLVPVICKMLADDPEQRRVVFGIDLLAAGR